MGKVDGRCSPVLAAALAVLLSLALGACGGGEPDGPPEPRAVVLVTIDTLRGDSLPFRSDDSPATPFMDSLAEKGIVYDRAYAPSSWTVPSMASLFTAVEPRAHGVNSGLIQQSAEGRPATVKNQPILPESFATLAETFRKYGYRTIGIPSNLHLGARQGFNQGFDFYYDEALFLEAQHVNAKTLELLELACGPRWREIWKDEKVFLWVHYFDPHVPYFARQPWIGEEAPKFNDSPSEFPAAWDHPELVEKFPRDLQQAQDYLLPLYNSEVSYVDDYMRQLNEEIGFIDDDVLLIVTSDHGEEFIEHGGFGHARTLYEETLLVPLLVYWPDHLARGKRSDDMVNILDIYPTLTGLLGMSTPQPIQGRMLPDLFEDQAPSPMPMYYHTDHTNPPIDAVRDGSWKLIRQGDMPVKLFDMVADPGEQNNVAQYNQDIVERLSAMLDRYIETLPPPPADGGTVETSEEEGAQLRDMGY